MPDVSVNGVHKQFTTLPPQESQSESIDDRLYELLARGQTRNENLLKNIGTKLDSQATALGDLKAEVVKLQVTPGLIKLVTFALVGIVVVVAITAGATLALDTGVLKVSTSATVVTATP